MNYRKTYGYTREQKSILFAMFLMTIFAMALLVSFRASGPLVLGSEMNTNGLVEYLCLGKDCNKLF